MSLLQGADPLDPKATQGPHPHPTPQGTRGAKDKGPKGTKGTKGTQGRLRRPWGSGPMGPFGGYSAVIPNGKPFRVEGYYERKAIPNESHSKRTQSERIAALGVGILVIVCVRASCNSTCKMLQASTAQIRPEGSKPTGWEQRRFALIGD